MLQSKLDGGRMWLGVGRFHPRHSGFWLLPILVLALAIRLAFLVQPLPWFVSMFSADDFFYYANTAFHLAKGHGSSFDGGLTQHNGYQPLFLWLQIPGFALGLQKTLMLKAVVTLLVGAWLVAMVLAYQIGLRLGGTWSALIAPALMGLSMEFVRHSLSGFETALVTALILAAVLACHDRRPAWLLGLLLGLAGLARLDSALIGVPIALVMLRGKRFRELAVVASIATLVVSPWLIWSWVKFGSPMPLSGVMKSWYGSPRELWEGPLVYARESAFRLTGNGSRDIVPQDVATAAGVLVLASVVRRGWSSSWLTLYAVGAPVVFALLTGSRYLPQFSRYCVPAFCLLTILLFARPIRFQRIWLVLIAALALSGSVKFMQWSLRSPPLDNFVGLCQREVPAIVDRITGPGDLVGCFDSGALGFFANQPVVNLDGLVNSEIYDLLSPKGGENWTRRYRRYLKEKGITVMVGGTGFSWVRRFPDLESWPELHPPLTMANGEQIVFLRVPDWNPSSTLP